MAKEAYQRKQYTSTDLAYLAGIIDGEGSIYIGNFSCNPKTGTKYYQTNIQVTNTDEPLIDWLVDTFGGLKSKRTRKQHADNSRKQAYVWTASGERLTHLCELIRPYLICKTRQCDIMLKMRATFERPPSKPGHQGTIPLDEDILNEREMLMQEMRSLHCRTWSYKNH